MMPGKDSGLARNYAPAAKWAFNNALPLLRYVFPNFVRSVSISSKNLANVYTNQPIKSGEYWDGNKPIPSSDESYDETREDELWQYLEGLDA